MLFLWLHLLRGLFIKLFFYSFISSVNVNSLASCLIYAESASIQGIKSIPSFYVSGARHFTVVNRVEVSFVNSFYFTFYYVYFIGIIIFLISIAVSLIGYTLVLGNPSYHGATAIPGPASPFPSLPSYFFLFLFLFFPFFLILFIIVFLFFFTV
jgi:hypothetical protein